MKGELSGLIIGISIGVVIGLLLAISALFCFRFHRKRSQIGNSSSRSAVTIPILANGVDSCSTLSDSSIGSESPMKSGRNGNGKLRSWFYISTLFSVFSLIPYAISWLYVTITGDENYEALTWNKRFYIALDVARGLEYLHDGAVPPVIHRDIKSSNILLDQSMRARVADFGLSKEEMVNKHAVNVRGTFGYLDPEYISTRNFTKKSDVYSFGVLLFELIAARNPQQGLMEYVELAAMNTEEKTWWEEIVDSHLDGNFDVQELNEVASLAYICVN